MLLVRLTVGQGHSNWQESLKTAEIPGIRADSKFQSNDSRLGHSVSKIKSARLIKGLKEVVVSNGFLSATSHHWSKIAIVK